MVSYRPFVGKLFPWRALILLFLAGLAGAGVDIDRMLLLATQRYGNTGAASVMLEVLEYSAAGGIVCLAGMSSGGHSLELDLGLINRRMVLENDDDIDVVGEAEADDEPEEEHDPQSAVEQPQFRHE